MLKREEFMQLQHEEKRKELIDIFSQLQDQSLDFEENIFLLESSKTTITDGTLNDIFSSLLELINKDRDISLEEQKKLIDMIHKKMELDTEKESEEADNLLLTI